MFPFTTVEGKEIIKNCFHNFHCKCQTNSNFSLGDSKFKSKCLTEKCNLDESFNNIIEESDVFMSSFDQKPNFTVVTRDFNYDILKYQKNSFIYQLIFKPNVSQFSLTLYPGTCKNCS